MFALKYLPKRYLSWCVGQLMHLRLPGPLARFSVRVFIKLYGIDPASARKPLAAYRSIGDFFTRDLRPELRPISGAVCCPVDGTLRGVHPLDPGGEVPQVKGVSYSLMDLLGGDPLAARFAQGQLWNFYLSPRDAHHIHAPVDGRIVKTVHIPGALWPVNTWALNAIPGLFAVNERVVSFIESEFGLLAVVMVGATNVGRIKLAYGDLETNSRPWRRARQKSIQHNPPIVVTRGEKIGTFKMGSSVVLVSERRFLQCAGAAPNRAATNGAAMQYGAPLVEGKAQDDVVGGAHRSH
jgi:phosphatidylserine decarboxylase